MKRNLLLALAAVSLAIGALASPAAANGSQTFRVDTRSDTVDANPGDGDCSDTNGDCSIRAAVQEANASGVPTTIRFGGGVYKLTLVGASEDNGATGDIDVTGTVRIVSSATIDLDSFGDRAFDVGGGGHLTVERLTVTNGAPPEGESGGAFRSSGELNLLQVHASNNVVVGTGASGGAVANLGGVLEVDTSRFEDNSATRAGGAIEANAGVTAITRSLMADNHTGPMPGNGGALHLTGVGLVTVNNTRVLGNSAAAEGGGLWNSAGGTMDIIGSQVRRNVALGTDADQGGGGLFNDGGTMNVSNTTVNLNSAVEGSGSGGGVLNNMGELNIHQSSIRDNGTARAGGAIETVAGNVSVTRSSLNNNTAGPRPGNGGAIHTSGPGTVDIEFSLVQGNTASNEGGGLWNSAVGIMNIRNTGIQGNVALGEMADNGGGGVFNQGNADSTNGGTMTIVDSAIRNNTAVEGSGSGGGILNEQGTLDVLNTSITGNKAARAGGGIEVVGGSDNVGITTLNMVDLMNNETGPRPGNGGGLHVSANSTVTISDARVVKNFAANEGGGLWNSPVGTLTVTDTLLRNNRVGVPGNGPNVFQKGPVNGGVFSLDGTAVEEGPNNR